MPRESKLPEQRREAEEQPETGQQTGGWGAVDRAGSRATEGGCRERIGEETGRVSLGSRSWESEVGRYRAKERILGHLQMQAKSGKWRTG